MSHTWPHFYIHSFFKIPTSVEELRCFAIQCSYASKCNKVIQQAKNQKIRHCGKSTKNALVFVCLNVSKQKKKTREKLINKQTNNKLKTNNRVAGIGGARYRCLIENEDKRAIKKLQSYNFVFYSIWNQNRWLTVSRN